MQQGNMTKVHYLDKLNNLVYMESKFKGEIHNQATVDIFTREKHPEVIYDIIDQEKKGSVQKKTKEQ